MIMDAKRVESTNKREPCFSRSVAVHLLCLLTVMATPTFIYKIVPKSSAPPTPLPEALPVSDLDNNDGFIHLSTSNQLSATLGRFFGKEAGVWILKIKYSDVEKDIKWEDSKKDNGRPFFFFLFSISSLTDSSSTWYDRRANSVSASVQRPQAWSRTSQHRLASRQSS